MTGERPPSAARLSEIRLGIAAQGDRASITDLLAALDHVAARLADEWRMQRDLCRQGICESCDVLHAKHRDLLAYIGATPTGDGR